VEKIVFETTKAMLLLGGLAATWLFSPSPAYAGSSALRSVEGVVTHVGRGNQGTEFYVRVNGAPVRFWFDNASNFTINGRHPNCQGMDSFGDFTKGTMPGCPGWAPVTIGKTRVRVSYREVQSEGSTVLDASSVQTI
jgi:hypothetical protein